MAVFDAISYAMGELVAYGVGKATGRALKLEPKRAQRIGESVVIGVVVAAGLIVTFVYS